MAGGRRKKARDYSSGLVVGPCSILRELSLPLLGAFGALHMQASETLNGTLSYPSSPNSLLYPCLVNLIDILQRQFDTRA